MSADPSRPHLLLPTGNHFDLVANCSIGRTAENDISLEGGKVSREHAHIYLIAGKFQLVDSQSRNGTYLNDQKVSRPIILKSGDRIRIGDHHLVFWHGAASASSNEGSEEYEHTLAAVSTVPCWLLLADVIDSTTLLQTSGSENYAHLVGAWFEACRSVIESYQGEINKSTGDGFLAFWRDEDHTKDGFVAGTLHHLSALRSGGHPAFRLLIHAGHVTMGGSAQLGEEALGGTEVHKIFRFEKAAGHHPCDVVASQEAMERLATYFHVESLGEVELKGFPGTYPAYAMHCPPAE